MEKEWHKIISFNGSQANGFEELVCQVAMNEDESKFKLFERVGTPDGGVECYWQLDDSSEWGWQAKYYDNLTSSEWNNIRTSLFDAAETHPALNKYFICLPHNLSDGRRGKTTQKDVWEKYKSNWTQELVTQGKSIEIILWNSSSLFSKLLLPKNEGIKSFFFQEVELKIDTLFLHLDAAIENLGPKYSPELNFKIDFLPTVFDALSRNSEFQKSFKSKLDAPLQKLNDVISNCSGFDESKTFKEILQKQYQDIVTVYTETDFSPLHKIPVETFLLNIENTELQISELKTVYKKIEAEYKEQQKKNQENKSYANSDSQSKKTDRETGNIFEFEKALDDFTDYLKSPVLRAANEGILFLKGKPGTGKSHLLADIALDRKRQHIPSVFLLGEHFSNQSPKIHIQQFLSPTHRLEHYLKSLESLGKAAQTRILFIVDAINEGVGRHIWKSNIAGLVKEFSQFKWIGFVFSYRSTYEDVVMPENFTPPLVTHNGFEGIEYEATKTFFDYYKIQQPAIPILNPEFSNPLFLKTFCITLNKSGRTSIPEGYEGISTILKEYIEAINHNIGERLNYPHKRINLVFQAIDEVIKLQIESDNYIIPWDKAFILIEPLLKMYSTSSGFLDELIKEGLFVEDYFYNRATNKYEQHGIVFNYERFNEHQKALYLLNNYSNLISLKNGFALKGDLYSLFYDKHGFTGFNAGLLNAFAIIVPEKYGVDLYEIFKVKGDYAQTSIYDAFLYSLSWRKPETIKTKSWEYVKQYLVNEQNQIDFFNTILLSAAHPLNPYNADFIHGILKDMSVAKRDYLWSITISKLWRWYDSNAIKRIIDWCWSEEDKAYTKDASILLLGKLLAWLFTTSNRAIRDKATKAFSTLFSTRVHLLQKIIEEFKEVNDPYVLERILAGTFGAITHSGNMTANTSLAQYVYDEFFSNRKPPLNVLTRDYGKSIVEYVVERGGVLAFEQANLLPPFDYSFPHDYIPNEEWISSKEIKKEEKYTDEERGQARILHSVLSWDFARYILGTNHGSSIPFTAYEIKSKEAYETLKKKLRGYKKSFLEIYVNAVTMINGSGELGKKLRRIFQGEELEQHLDHYEKSKEFANKYLKEKLSAQEKTLFENAQSFMESGFETETFDVKRFDVKLVQRYILKKVFDLGWNMEDFGWYDANNDEDYRRANKAERIGKKYQWIAYYEIMALLSDNYDFLDRYSDDNKPYLGTWQHNFRNIDPTAILKRNPEGEEKDDNLNKWWITEAYSNWNEERSTWLKRFDDMPDFRKLVIVKDNQNEEWYLMYDFILWHSPKPIGKERYNANRKELWIDVKAFLMDKTSKAHLYNSASKILYWINQEIPQNPHYYDVFLGELYYSEAYNAHMNGHYEKRPYSTITSGKKKVKVLHTVEDYGFESEYDLSGEKLSIYKPSKFLFDLLEAQAGKNDACIYDKAGNIISYDPGAYAKQSERCFLVKKKVLDEYLLKNNLEIGWTFCGEKQDIGQSVSYVYRMLFSGFATYQGDRLQYSYHHQLERDS